MSSRSRSFILPKSCSAAAAMRRLSSHASSDLAAARTVRDAASKATAAMNSVAAVRERYGVSYMIVSPAEQKARDRRTGCDEVYGAHAAARLHWEPDFVSFVS